MRIQKQQLPSLLLRIGLVVVFLYAAAGSLMQPDQWVGYLPSFLATMSNATSILKAFAVFEIILSVWLLSGRLIKYAALVAAAMFLGIILAQPGDLIVTFRDIGLVFMALALVFM